VLSVYTRHYPPCQQQDPHFRGCKCPKWLQGTLWPYRERVRKSANTRNWKIAERRARALERAGDEAAGVINSVTVEKVVTSFLAEQEAKRLAPPTIKKDQNFLGVRFLAWCEDHHFKYLKQIGAIELREFRQTWNNHVWTVRRKHERLRRLFAFCVGNGWVERSPMDLLAKPPAPKTTPTNYFTRKEFETIVQATCRYSYGGGHDCHYRGTRVRALVLLMGWSGLAIKDAVSLERTRLDQEGCLFLRRAKTNVPVFVPLPPKVVALLQSLPSENSNYFFWSGRGDVRHATKAYQRSFWKLFRLANLTQPDGSPKRCHSHMLRDTFAVELLLAAVPIEQVSILLGHSSVKMTEKHYLPWVKARQEQLTASVHQAWLPEVL
jgi:integrase